jgi:DHA3 family macrolide efflux protein-like MFS transporter
MKEHRMISAFLASQIINECGTWISRIALLAYMYQRTGSGALVIAVLLADSIPRTLLSIPLGWMSSRIGARTSCLISNVGQAALILLVLLVAPNQVLILTLIAAKASFGTLYGVGSLSLIPNLVQNKANLMQRNSLLGAGSAITAAVGPALGGVIYGLDGLTLSIWLDAFSFLLSALLLIPLPEARGATASRHASRQRGIQEIWRSGARAGALISIANGIAIAGGGILNSALPVFLQGPLKANPQTLGATMAAFGAGAIVISLSLSVIKKTHHYLLLFMVALSGSAATIFYLGFSRYLWLAALLLFLLGCFSAIRGMTARTSVQLSVSNDALGPIIGIYQSLVNGGLLTGMLIAAGLIIVFPATDVLLAASPFYLLALVITFLAAQSQRSYSQPANPLSKTALSAVQAKNAEKTISSPVPTHKVARKEVDFPGLAPSER